MWEGVFREELMTTSKLFELHLAEDQRDMLIQGL